MDAVTQISSPFWLQFSIVLQAHAYIYPNFFTGEANNSFVEFICPKFHDLVKTFHLSSKQLLTCIEISLGALENTSGLFCFIIIISVVLPIQ